MWESLAEAKEEADQSNVLYAEDDGQGSKVVRVPADEPASKADLMALAGQVRNLQREVTVLRLRLGAAAALLDDDAITDALHPSRD